MKKIIALLLALIMTFSVATVAFATEGEATTPDTETTDPAEGEENGELDILGTVEGFLGEYEWILDLPFGVVPPALKIAKIALKFVKVYFKICGVFGLDPMETAKGIVEFIAKTVEDYQASQGENTTPETETTTAPAAA